MENKQYPPRGGPPLECQCRGTPARIVEVKCRAPAIRSGPLINGKIVPYSHWYALPPLGWRGFRTAHLDSTYIRIEDDAGPPGRFPVPNPEGFGNLQGLKNSAGTREWFAQKIPEDLHGYSLHIRDGTKTRACGGTVFRIRDGTRVFPTAHSTGWRDFRIAHLPGWRGFRTAHLIPEGLHVYSNGKHVLYATPAGVLQKSASWHFYKHLIPSESCEETEVRTRDGTKTRARDGTVFPVGTPGNIRDGSEIHIRCGTGLGSRNPAANRPVQPPEWERYGGKLEDGRRKLGDGSRKSEDGSWKSGDGRRRSELERRTAAASRNLCRIKNGPMEKKVQRTVILNGNMECKIRKLEDGRQKAGDGTWNLLERSENPDISGERGTRKEM